MSFAQQIMKTPITVEYTASIADVMRQLLLKNLSRLAVTKNGNVFGIITEKDIGFFLLSDDSEKNLTDMSIEKLIKPIVTVDEAMSIPDCAKLMMDRKIGSLGVNSRGITKGILTKTDLTKYYRENHVGKKRVGDLMTISFITEYENEPINKIISKMIDEKISRLILKNRKDDAVGIITFRDFFRIALTLGKEERIVDNSDPSISVTFSRKGFLSKSGFGNTILARELMKNEITSVDYDDDVVMACAELLENDMNGVGVLINGKLSGILSKTDITRAIATI